MRSRLLDSFASIGPGYGDVRIRRHRGTAFEWRNRRIEAVRSTAGTVGVARVLAPGRAWGVAGFSDGNGGTAAVRQALEISSTRPLPGPILLAPVSPRRAEFPCPDGRDPRRIPLVRKRALTELVGTALFATDRRIADVCVRYRDTVDDIWVVTSEGADLHETQSDITIEVLVQAEEAGTTEHALASLSVRGDWAAVERWAAAVGEVAERAVRLLHAVPVRSGRVPVILGPRAAGVLVHRVAGHLCLGDGEAEDTPSLEIGTRLGPEALVIGDDGTAPDLRGTRAFDDEGTPPLNTVLVRSGVLIGRIHTRASAALAGATPTGNARAGGLRAPSARLSNTYLAGGRGSLDDLLRDVPAGVYIEDLEHLSLRAGRAVIRAGFARVIRRGGLAEVVKNLAVAGEVLALFGQIDRVAGDFSWDPGASRCDGGVGGALPVSTGAPHVRLVDVMVGAAA